jgi:virginiamycin B lyase
MAAFAACPAAASLPAGTVVEFQTAAGAGAREIVLGRTGNAVWFTEPGLNTLGSITDKSHYRRLWIPTRAARPDDIASAADGTWFTEPGTDRIAHVTGGRVTSYRLAGGSGPRGITAGPDGAVWFTEAGADRIGRINATTGRIQIFRLPTPAAAPTRIAAGPDGNLWFTERARDRIGRITPAGAVTEFPLPTGSAPFDITAGPDGNMWFTLRGMPTIGTISMSGAATLFPIPAPGAAGLGIAAGTDGAVWFTQPAGDELGRIVPDGTVTEVALTAGARPSGITTGLRGQIWFAEPGTGRIGELGVAAPHTQYVSVTAGFVQQSPPRALVGTTVQWTFFGPTPESVTDATGMGLFDSGVRGFVSSYSHTFTAAGDYPYRSATSGMSAVYKILPRVPRRVTAGTAFSVRWATAAPASGFGFDVRVKPPGASAFQHWQTGTTRTSAQFTPSGPGTYVFEARLVAAGAASLWSPAARVAVS